MKWVLSLSAYFSRSSAETATARAGRGKWPGIVALGAAFGLWVSLFLPTLSSQLSAWSGLTTPVPLERGGWTHLGPSEPNAYERLVGADKLARADAVGATVLYLGEFFSPYKVTIDGVPVAASTFKGPVFVDLSTERLKSGRDLKLRIEVVPSTDGGLPADVLGKRTARTIDEGFLSPFEKANVTLMLDIYRRVRPAAFTLVYLVISAIFFLLWQGTPLRLDYFGLAIFTMSSAFYQASRTDFLAASLSHTTRIWLGVVTKGSFAVTAAALGFAFARWRKSATWGVLFIGLLVCAVGAMVAPHLESTRMIESFIERWLVPVGFVCGAFACFIEAGTLVFQSAESAEAAKFRVRSLAAFGLAMFFMGTYYFSVERDLVPARPLLWLLMGTETFGLVLFLSSLALRDYHTQQRLLARIPVSPYHQSDPLPAGLSGALMMVDIKNSELLFRMGAAEGNAGMLVDRCLSHLWSAVVRAGGFVLRTDGDGLAAFFNADKCPRPMDSALEAADAMCSELALLAEQLADEGYLSPEAARLDFRGSITLGQIRPIWLEIGGTRAAAWTEAGNQNTFVEGARLLDLERTIDATKTAVLVPERDTQASKMADWTKRGLTLTGKHGATYQVAVYMPKAVVDERRARKGAAA